MSNDPFSDILRLTEAKAVVAGSISAGGDWAVHFPAPQQIKFTAAVKGNCWLRVDGQCSAVHIEEGDVFMLPGRDGFVIASRMSVPPVDAIHLKNRQNGRLSQLGEGSDFVMVTGLVSLHPSSGALLTDVLPPLAHVRAGSPQAASLRWIAEQIVHEHASKLPGSSVTAAQLAQLMFTQVLRAHLATSHTLPSGWLRAMSDDRLVHALRLMHGDPSRAWRLSDLAKAAGMSRTNFAVHFKSVAGVAPLVYLAEWRMQLAQRMLREADTSVLQLAESLGYASESAFSNAFKRVTGKGPRDYRSAARTQIEPVSG